MSRSRMPTVCRGYELNKFNRKDLTAMGQPVAIDIEVLKCRSVSMANTCILCMNIPCHYNTLM